MLWSWWNPAWNNDIITALIVAIILYIVAKIRSAFLGPRPNIFIQVDSYYYQRVLHSPMSYEIGWRHEVSIQNNSKLDVYNVKFHFPRGYDIFDSGEAVYDFRRDEVKILGNTTLETEGTTRFFVNGEYFYNFHQDENGPYYTRKNSSVYDYGETLKPEKIKKKIFYISFKSENGTLYYTEYNNNKTSNTTLIKPLYINLFFKYLSNGQYDQYLAAIRSADSF